MEGGSRGGSQHPDKRALTDRTINLADVVEHTLPTPKIKDRAQRGPGATGGPDLGEAVALLNSPTVSEGTGVGEGRRKASTLRGQVDELPTPTTRYAGSGRERFQERKNRSPNQRPSDLRIVAEDELMPTPRTGSNRNSRKGLVPDGHNHWAAPALEQVTDFLDGELPREYADPSEVKGAAEALLDLLPTPSTMGGGERTRGGDRSDELLLPGVAEQLMPTPSAHDGTAGGDLPSRAGGPSLGEAAKLMPTPKADDGRAGSPGNKGSSGDLTLPSAALELMPTPDAQMGGAGGRSGDPEHRRDTGRTVTINEVAQSLKNWGPYEAAIRRWERVLGREAPWATEPSPRSKKGRLSPRFVEWMMGWAEGWVTALSLSRNSQLKILGNGVVPQQAEAAVRFLLAPPRHREHKKVRKVPKRATPRGMMKAAKLGGG